MKKEEKQLLGEYRKMTPQNKKRLLSLAHSTRATLEKVQDELMCSVKQRKNGCWPKNGCYPTPSQHHRKGSPSLPLSPLE